MAKQRFGEYLVQRNIISRDAVSAILDEQRVVKEEFGQLAVRRGFLTEKEQVKYLSDFLGISLLDVEEVFPGPAITSKITKKLALKLKLFPLGLGAGGELICACAGPINIAALQSVSRLVNRAVVLRLVTRSALRKMQNEQYSRQFDTSIKVSKLSGEDEDVHLISELLEKLLLRAINMEASDIHIEPTKADLVVRFRVDGILVVVENLPTTLTEKVLTRVKVLSRLDIAEKRMPQDGGFFFQPERLDVDIEGVNIRTSTFPIVYGEKAVMRILPAHDSAISLESIGMQDDTLARFKDIVSNPYGIVLVTGPTGSGKSTTLYSVLQILRSDAVNLVTLEDPVEMKMQGITQTQIDLGPKISFAGALRSILRQDPDIIMIGEIRDSDTVQVALQAAITGHLVLSTLHTNDAPSAFDRLIDMGAEPFLIANSIRGILAQRLVRKVCLECGVEEKITEGELQMLGLQKGELQTVFRGAGCDACGQKGYSGRSGIYELVSIDDKIERMVATLEKTNTIKDYARKHLGYRTLREEGIIKVRQGITTPEEVMRVSMG